MDLSLLPLVFCLILTVASRLLNPYCTSRLVEKRFSTVSDTQRGSQNNMEKRSGRKEIKVTRRRIGGIKRIESDLASTQFHMHIAQNTQRGSQSWVEKRRGREEIEVTWGRKRRVKRGESDQASITLLSKNGY